MTVESRYTITDNAKEVVKSIQDQINLLAGRLPDIRDARQRPLGLDRGNIRRVTEPQVQRHIDIIGELPVTLCYDLGTRVSFDRLALVGFYHPTSDYTTAAYEWYCSDEREALFERDNCVAAWDNTGKWKADAYFCATAQMFCFSTALEGRFVGLRILRANATDEIIRLSTLCVFSRTYTRQHRFLKTFGDNLLAASAAQPEGELPPGLEGLTDEVAFCPERAFTWKAGQGRLRLAYPLKDERPLDRVVLLRKSGAAEPRQAWGFHVYAAQDRTRLYEAENRLSTRVPVQAGQPEPGYVLETYCLEDRPVYRWIGLELVPPADGGEAEIHQFGAYSWDCPAHFMEEAAVCGDFAGIGTNVLPMALMEESRQSGYTQAHWEIECRRFLTIRPRMVRLWFQIDWMTDGKDRFVFDTPKMQAFYQYLDLFAAAGSDVQLNFGWKNGRACLPWFAIPGVSKPYNSAPADLEHFAAACSALLQELIDRRGYGNIRYLSFYNEPNGGDFDTPGDAKAYYAQLLRAADARLRRDGLRNRVAILGPEEVYSLEWFLYMAEHADAQLDGYSFHMYDHLCDELPEQILPRKEAAAGKPLYITEFGWLDYKEQWGHNNIGYVIGAANLGVRGLLHWMLDSVIPTDPLDFELEDSMFLWGLLQKEGGMDRVNLCYYQVGLLMRYILPHSTVWPLHTGDDTLRGTVFRSADGDYTVVVEANRSTRPRHLRVDLGEDSRERVFGRHSVKRDVVRDGNALLAPRAQSIESRQFLEDWIDEDYQLVVYTTLPAQPQIAVYPTQCRVRPGESVSFAAKTIDFEDDIVWELSEEDGGTIDAQGIYRAPQRTAARTVAVRARDAKAPGVVGLALIQLEEKEQ